MQDFNAIDLLKGKNSIKGIRNCNSILTFENNNKFYTYKVGLAIVEKNANSSK